MPIGKTFNRSSPRLAREFRQPVRLSPLNLWARLGWRGRSVYVGAIMVLLVSLGLAAAIGALMWRLSSGPIEVEDFEETVGVLIAEQFGDARAEIGTVSVARDKDGDIVVQLYDLRLFDAQNKQILRAPLAAMGTSLFAVLTGAFTPTSIELIGPHLQIRRLLDGSVQLEVVEPDQASSGVGGAPVPPGGKADAGDFRAPVDAAGNGVPAKTKVPAPQPAAAVNNGAGPAGVTSLLNVLNNLEVRDARLSVYDEASRTVWRSFAAQLSYRRDEGGAMTATLDAPFSTDSGAWRITARMDRAGAEGPTRLQTRFTDVVPAEIAARIPQLSVLTGLDLPVTGSIDVSFAGGVQSASTLTDLKVDLVLGAGFFRGLPDLAPVVEPILIDEGRISLSYNKAGDRVEIDRFEFFVGKNRLNVNGFATLEREGDTGSGPVSGLAFQLGSRNAAIAAEDLGLPAVLIRQARANGKLSFSPFTLTLQSGSLVLDKGQIVVGGTARLGETPDVRMRATVRDLPVDALVQLWPQQAGPGVRSWVAESIATGTVATARVAINLDAEAFEAMRTGQPLPEDAVVAAFSVTGVTAQYMTGMPPIEQGSARAVVQGDRFVLSLDRGFVRSPTGTRVGITFGRFSIPTFIEDPATGYLTGNISMALAGALGATMEILDLEPLGFARAVGVDPARIVGDAEVNLRVGLPLLSTVEFDQIQIQAGAVMRDVLVPDMFGDVDLTAKSLEIIATQRDIQAAGEVRMADVPASLKWRAQFGGGGSREDRLTLSTEVPVADLKKLGINLTELVEGVVPMTIVALGSSKALSLARIDADVTKAKVKFDPIGWVKEPGRQARVKFEAETLDNGQIRLRNIDFRGKGIDVRGAVRLDTDGSIFKVDIKRMRLDGTTDISVTGLRSRERILNLTAKGKSLDVRPILGRLGEKSQEKARSSAGGVDVAFAIASVRGRGKTSLKDVIGTLKLRQDEVRRLRIKGQFASKGTLNLNYARSANNPAVLSVDTNDAGGFFRLSGFYTRAIGGRMALRAKGNSAAGGELVGVASVRNFHVVNEPLLAQLFANEPSSRGTSAKKVPFTKMQIKFRRVGDIVEIKNALLAGPTVGASIRGRINTANQAVSINGTYVPAYGLNAAFGSIPLVGTILTGRAGEGIVGMTFGVTGTMAKPKISINPLSAVAPGFLRLFFEFQSR